MTWEPCAWALYSLSSIIWDELLTTIAVSKFRCQATEESLTSQPEQTAAVKPWCEGVKSCLRASPRHLAASDTAISGCITAGRTTSQPARPSLSSHTKKSEESQYARAGRQLASGMDGNPDRIFDAFLRYLLFCPSTTHCPYHSPPLLPLLMCPPPSFPLPYCCIDEIK